jgi:hypothetical protein
MATIPKRTIVELAVIMTLMAISPACTKHNLLKDDELSLKKRNYQGKQLRIDGYYYGKYLNDEYIDTYFFYSDGTLMYGGTCKASEIDGLEHAFKTQEFVNKGKDVKYYWGLFQIDDNTIQFERWYPGEPPYKSYIRSGAILNDTTFHISKSMRSDGSEEREKDELYHFKQFSPKPDSTNSFVQ